MPMARATARNDAEAVKWYRQAAEKNLPLAEYYLGRMYADGRGVPRDEREALQWFRRAAEQNIPLAQLELANSYLSGPACCCVQAFCGSSGIPSARDGMICLPTRS